MDLRHFTKDAELALEKLESVEDRVRYYLSDKYQIDDWAWNYTHKEELVIDHLTDTKPRRAFWVSDEGAARPWTKYVRESGINFETDYDSYVGPYEYRVELHDTERALIMDDYWKLSKFAKMYGVEKRYLVPFYDVPIHINWWAVLQDYDAVIISPYAWGLRSDAWYSNWDCASGPILHPRIVKSLERVS